jgi:large subunit ribosomal protein L23
MPDFHYADVLIHPIITEKSNEMMATEGKYLFIISPRATKTDVRRAVSERFNVKVEAVNIINLPRKPKRFGRFNYMAEKRRKAIVTLVAGEHIHEMSEAV